MFLICFCLITNAQTYKPLLDNFNEWRFTYCYLGSCSDDTYFTNGDIYNGGYYYKILDGYHFISGTFWLREDTITQSVYLSYQLGPGGRREVLLYDFSLQVGDSIDMKNPSSPFLMDAGYYTVDSILMKPLHDGNNYKHYFLSPSISNSTSSNRAEWIEGVGSLSLINAPSGFPDVNGVGKLSCFFKNGNLFYSNLDSTTSCNPTILCNHNTEETILKDINIYPTIIDDHCHITGINNNSNISIYNIDGLLIKQQSIHNNSEIDLNLDALKSGFYFLVLSEGENLQHTFKVYKK
ncbi:MAG: T9SS type A sorting domain-containing protein [Saprospiraceae bacterium]|nr:T9SS type A sorting domain-containing protein [Saprospiraceae bacterium]